MKIPHFEAIFRGSSHKVPTKFPQSTRIVPTKVPAKSSHKSHTLALKRAETFVNTSILKPNFAGTKNKLIFMVFRYLFSNWLCAK